MLFPCMQQKSERLLKYINSKHGKKETIFGYFPMYYLHLLQRFVRRKD
jgi:hypothetical protein